MKVLELFAGTKSIGKVAERRGHEAFSADIVPEFNCSLTKDILDVTMEDIPWIPDMIWASPPCTYFSVASIGKHWNKDHTPKTEEAVLGTKIAFHTYSLIKELSKLNPLLIWFIENPRAKLRKLDIIPLSHLETVCYCQYGGKTMKPTDIWTNCPTWAWTPRPMCHNYKKDEHGNIIKHCHHEPAPRGSQSGVQGIKGNKLRSVIPPELCEEVVFAVEDYRIETMCIGK